MTTRNLQTRLLFSGGWATDFGPSATVSVQQDGTISIPFLIDAENVEYNLDGGPEKFSGTVRINNTAINGAATVRGIVDFWVIGTGATNTQHRVVHAGDDVQADSADGVFASILSSADRNTTSIPSYAVYDDELIIMSDANEAPLKWTGTGDASTLGTNTPKFAFGVTHKNRFWGAGVRATKSRLFYSEPLPNGADGNWEEVEAGFIDIDPDDNDEIRGLVSHKNILWVFKGPYTGSIHKIIGDTPLGGVTAFAASTQPVPFSREKFVHSVGAAGHNSIFRFGDDIGFVDGATGSIRSLNATAEFGDFREVAFSFPINDFLKKNIDKTKLKKIWATTDTSNSRVLFTIASDGSSLNNIVLSMDYRFDPPRWSKWSALVAECVTTAVNPDNNNQLEAFFGCQLGVVRHLGATDNSIDGGQHIPFRVTLPFIDYGNPIAFKTLSRGSVGIRPRGNYNLDFNWTRDGRAKQGVTISQGGTDILGGTAGTPNVFILGTSTLSGTSFQDRFFSAEEGGEFRSIQYQVEQTGLYESIELGSIFTSIEINADSTENT